MHMHAATQALHRYHYRETLHCGRSHQQALPLLPLSPPPQFRVVGRTLPSSIFISVCHMLVIE